MNRPLRVDDTRPMIDLRYVKKLIDIIDESTVDSIEISTEKGMKIRISKTPQQRGGMQVAAQVPMQMQPAGPVGRATPAEGVALPTDAPTEPPPPAPSSLREAKSPMVGTFYASPEPGAKPYVAVGSRVAQGEVLCIIEAMKIMNEIESEFGGVVKEVLVQDSQPVEYGQVLFRIDPNG
jgi:acetyl-CoA carboxylase biotin carboxyl carrier protein